MDVKLMTTQQQASYSELTIKNSTIKKEKNLSILLQTDLQVDTYQSQQPQKKVTYDNPTVKPDMETVSKLMEESDQAFNHLKQIVTEMLRRQGLEFRDIKAIKPEELEEIEIDETARKEAEAMIAEGGDYSAENVSDRIVDFAKAISGGDKSKLGLLRAAIEAGFKAAEKTFGDELPDISKETHQLIIDKLDAWENEGKVSETEDGPPETTVEIEAYTVTEVKVSVESK